MEIFGIGLPETILILVVVLLIFGPDQLPEIAKKLGGATRELRRNLNAMSNEVNANLAPIKDLTDLSKPLPPSQPALPAAPASNLIVADESEVRAEAAQAAAPPGDPPPVPSADAVLASAENQKEETPVQDEHKLVEMPSGDISNESA